MWGVNMTRASFQVRDGASRHELKIASLEKDVLKAKQASAALKERHAQEVAVLREGSQELEMSVAMLSERLAALDKEAKEVEKEKAMQVRQKEEKEKEEERKKEKEQQRWQQQQQQLEELRVQVSQLTSELESRDKTHELALGQEKAAHASLAREVESLKGVHELREKEAQTLNLDMHSLKQAHLQTLRAEKEAHAAALQSLTGAHELSLAREREALEARERELDTLKSAHELARQREEAAQREMDALRSAHELWEKEATASRTAYEHTHEREMDSLRIKVATLEAAHEEAMRTCSFRAQVPPLLFLNTPFDQTAIFSLNHNNRAPCLNSSAAVWSFSPRPSLWKTDGLTGT